MEKTTRIHFHYLHVIQQTLYHDHYIST